MTAPAAPPGGESAAPSDNDPGRTSLIIADTLTGQELGAFDPAESGSRLILVLDAGAARCQVLVSRRGPVSWEYVPFGGRDATPGSLARLIRDVLGAPDLGAASRRPPAGPSAFGAAAAAVGQLAAVERALGGSGLGVRVRTSDGGDPGGAELVVTHPGRPGRGQVVVTEDGEIIWECRLADAPDGLDAATIAATIGAALAGRTRPPGQSRAKA